MQSKYTMRFIFVFLSFSLNIFAIDGKIKVFIKSNDAIYTSQKVTVSVELLSSAFSITDVKITFPASKKYIIQAPSSAAYLGQEEVEDEDWQMVHYEYEVYALQAGKIEIPSVAVSFTSSMGYGQPKKEFVLKSEPLHFDVKAPEGVKANQFVLVTDKFMLNSELKPNKKDLIIGDAVTLSITQKAQGIPDILLSPIVYKSNAFLRVYEKEPSLKNGLKGEYDVSRTDRFTFVASAEGNVTLPEQEILWWNSRRKKIHVEKISAISFEIIADPQIAIDAKKEEQKQRMLYLIVTLLFLFVLYKIFASKVREYVNTRKRAYVLSEEGRFNMLLGSCEGDSIREVYHALYAWLEVADPMLSRKGLKGIAEVQPSFSDMLNTLDTALAIPEQRVDKTSFTGELQKLRKRLLKIQHLKGQGLPGKINPN